MLLGVRFNKIVKHSLSHYLFAKWICQKGYFESLRYLKYNYKRYSKKANMYLYIQLGGMYL